MPETPEFSKKNGGVSSARNLGIKKSKGDFLLFVDSDDEVSPEFISSLVMTMKNPAISLAVTGVRYKKLGKGTDENVYLDAFPEKSGESLEAFVLRSLLHDGRMYPVFNKIFRAEIVRKNRLTFDETLKFAEDTKFVLDYLKLSSGKIEFIL